MKKALLALLALGLMVAFSSKETIQKEWEQSAHNNGVMGFKTLTEATVEARQANAAHCARCHSEQGFLAWLEQLKKGNPGNLVGPDGKPATVDYLKSLGLTKDQVRPITCNTCHDEDGDLRLVHDTPMLPPASRPRRWATPPCASPATTPATAASPGTPRTRAATPTPTPPARGT
ncbi:hypothetical protein [Thermus sp. 2.9]|uniref:hypothetical protein n=1 Tax=Thermus sp. (strain 2.9) TaxID=1577051 RepID=UPI000A4863EF|nr:hypothetical protein [Thermus sp. 2.9]